jgi:hypothetical protein
LPLWSLTLGSAALAVLATLPRVASGHGRTRDVASVFFVAKSENHNQVHYGVHLDDACSPAGPSPVFAYWRMLEHGPLATEALLPFEAPAYGVADQRVLARGPAGGEVRVSLRALPARTIVIVSRTQGEACAAGATTTIGGAPAALASVYAKLSWPFGVDYLMLWGRNLSDGHEVREQVVP